MGRALSRDLQDRVVADVEGRLSCRQVAERFGVSVTSAIRWRQPVLVHGMPAGKVRGGDRRTAKIEDHAAFILKATEQPPDPTRQSCGGCWLREPWPRASSRYGASLPGRDHTMKTGHASERDRHDVLKCREEWFEGQLNLDPDRLVFSDETPAFTGAGSGRPPARPATMGDADAGSDCAPAFLLVTGKP